MLRLAHVSFPLVLVALLLNARPASAQLNVCNQTSETVSIALAYRGDADFVSKGWYVAEPGQCRTVVTGALENRYYYVHAEGSKGNRWLGDYSFCVKNDPFAHVGDECGTAGMVRRSFFVIDTGSSTSWTQGLTEGPTDVDNRVVHDTIAGLQLDWRRSLLDESWVMVLHNKSATTVDVRLKCFTTSGSSKTLTVEVPGRGVGEVGFVQGWPGNFVRGESCEAYHGSELVWRTSGPR